MGGLLLSLAITAGFILLGYLVGRAREAKHLADLDRREAAAAGVTVVDVKRIPPGFAAGGGRLVMGEVVIATDYFKSFMAMLRNIVGGEVKTYQTLLSRARREARLRMIEEAQAARRRSGRERSIRVVERWSEDRQYRDLLLRDGHYPGARLGPRVRSIVRIGPIAGALWPVEGGQFFDLANGAMGCQQLTNHLHVLGAAGQHHEAGPLSGALEVEL